MTPDSGCEISTSTSTKSVVEIRKKETAKAAKCPLAKPHPGRAAKVLRLHLHKSTLQRHRQALNQLVLQLPPRTVCSTDVLRIVCQPLWQGCVCIWSCYLAQVELQLLQHVFGGPGGCHLAPVAVKDPKH